MNGFLQKRKKQIVEEKSEFVFPIFGPWTLDLPIVDLKIGFLVENCIYGQLEMSRIPKFGPKMVKLIL